MNYAGKFGSSGLDSLAGTHVELDSASHRGHADSVTVPDAHLLFSGDFQRSGSDLIISDDHHRVVVPDYFHGSKRPALVSPDGAPLDPKVIEALTGHTAYAQAGGAPAAKVVGHAASMTGSASIVRNGVTIVLNNGDAVYQSDVVQTGSGSTLGLVLIDGTTFNLTAGARLMLNDLTYEATSTSNSALFTLVQGAASFVAGQVAKTGDMKVGTPIATMGIRGTAVILDISSVDGRVSMSVVDQHDGQIHAIQVFNARGDLIGTVTSNGSTLTLTPTATFEVIAQESNKTVQQIAQEFNAFRDLLNTYNIQKAIDPNLPQHTDNGSGNDANPKTKFAGLGSSSPSSPQTEFHGPTGTGSGVTGTGGEAQTPGTFTVQSGGAQGGGSGQFPSGPLIQQFFITPTVGTPFPVTPSTVSRISSGPGDHFGPVMSADGRFVTYDPDGAIYLFDRSSGATVTIQAPGGGFTFGSPTISSDGHFIVYQRSDGVVFLYNNNASDAANYQHVSAIGAGTSPAISGDGNVIVVERGGASLVGLDQQGHTLFTITPASAGVSGALWKPAISADGHLVAFWDSDAASAGGSGHLMAFDRSTGLVTTIAGTAHGAGANAASISADGKFVTYQSDSSGHAEIYLYNLTTRQVVFHTADASGGSYNPVISPDGHFIIFASDAQLTANDGNSVADTYVVDVTDPANPIFKLVSVGADGSSGNAASNLGGAISTGGHFIAFGSSASNFSNGDDNGSGDIFVVDPSSGRDVIIQEDANSPSVLTASGVIAITGGITGVTINVSDPSKFSAVFSGDGRSIVWTYAEPKANFDFLSYGQDATRPFVITLSSVVGTYTIPVNVTVHDAVPNAAPVIESANLTVSEGGIVAFGPGNIGISDADDSNFTFKVFVAHGQFQVLVAGQWYNTATFTSAEMAGGAVRFIHDGSEFAPVFAIQADDGEGVNSRSNILAGGVNFTHVNDAPVISTAKLLVSRGGTVVLDAVNLDVTHTDSFANFSDFPTRADLPAFSSAAGSITMMVGANFPLESIISVNDPDSSSFTFTVTNVSHGAFQVLVGGETWVDATLFTSADLNAGHVRFVREDSEATPTFSIQADDGAATNHVSSVFVGTVANSMVVSYNTAPVITAASLTVSEGGTIVITPADIAVTDPQNSSFTFTVSNVSHGTFQTTADGIHWITATHFTTADLNASHVRFVHDGGEAAPTFSIQADDGAFINHLGNVFTGSVTFSNVNDAPVAAPVTLAAGTEDHSYVITPEALLGGVSDIDGPSLTITDVTINSGGGSIFRGETGSWTYTPGSNYHGPVSFNYTVSDGSLTASSTASLTLASVNDAPTVSGAVTGTATEDGTPGFLNALANASDADGDTLAVVNVPETLPAGVHYNGELQSFFLDPSDAAFQHLGANDTTTISVSYGISDGHVTVPGSVSWTVHGINDAPVIAAGTVVSGSIDVPVATAAHNTLSPELASELHASGLISGLPGESGFGTQALGPGDDNSSGAINITSVFGASGVNFFGHNYTSLYINNNGNITFGASSSTFTPSEINAGLNNPIIAAFWADVDTNGHGAVSYDLDAADGVMTITWDQVGYYYQHTDKLNSFQLVLINEGNGNFDIEYRYGNIQWTTGDVSSGIPARAGYSAGDHSHYFELPQSGIQAALLSLSSTPGNTGIVGVDHLEVRNGEVGPSSLTSTGTIDFSDPDFNDVHAVQSVTYTGSGNELGTLTLVKATDTTGTGTGGQFVWTYTADPATVRAALAGTPSHSKVETFDVVIGDGHGGTLSQTVSVTLNETGVAPTVTITVLTPDGMDFAAHNSLREMGAGTIQSGGSSMSFTILDSAADREFVIDGSNFTYADGAVTGGTITSFHEFKADGTTALADFTGLSVNAATWMSAVQQEANGDNTAIEALTSAFAYNFIGGPGPDSFGAAGQADTLTGTGRDFFDGGGAPAGSHDTLTGGAGSTFVFAQGYGALTITNFDQASGAFNRSDGDHIELDGFAGTPTVTYVNGNTIADFGNGDVLTLLHVNPADIHDSDFIRSGDGNGNGNNGPMLSNADNSVTYTGTPVFLDPSIAVTDATGTVSSVNVWISSGFHSGDTLTINGGMDGDIANSNGTIHYRYDANARGIILSTSHGGPTLGDFDAALHLIQFSNTGSDPTAGGTDTSRTVTWAAQDDANLFSHTVTTTINVGPILNHAPVFDGHDLTPIYHHGDAAVALTDHVSATDIDSDNYAGGTLTATVINGSHPGDTLSIVGDSHISLLEIASGTTVMYDSDGVGGDDPVAIGTLSSYYNSLTVTLNAHADDAAVAALTQAIKYSTSYEIVGTRTVAFTLKDGGGTENNGHDSDYFEAHVTVPTNAAPLIQTDQFTVSEGDNGVTTVSGLYVTDTDVSVPVNNGFTLLATTGAPAQSSVDPSSGSGFLWDINATLRDGVTYNPGEVNQPDADSVTFTVTDGAGHSDTVHFIFNNQDGDGEVELSGTDGKDVIFATGNTDTLTGRAGADQFVFRVGDGNDTITDFATGQDHIDLRAFFAVDTGNIDEWLGSHAKTSPANSADVLITLDEHDSITLKNVAVTSLHANDFILHPGGGHIA